MSLSDKEILELAELCDAIVDETATNAQKERLAQWLKSSEDARQHFVRTMGMSASLYTYASEMQTEGPVVSPATGIFSRAGWWWLTGIAAAACLAAFFGFALRSSQALSPAAAPPVEYVARLTGLSAAPWADPTLDLHLGDRLRKGQQINLNRGTLEVTFDSGAQVILEGPSSLDLNSGWNGTLRKGALKAYVPPEAIGFRISHPSVDVVDFGTEFTMIADASGAADVLVLKGEVEAAPRESTGQDAILMRAQESRRFASSGISEVSDSDQTFAPLAHPASFQRFEPGVHCVRWIFGASPARAAAVGMTPGDYDLHLQDAPAGPLAWDHSANLRTPALRFDGKLYAKAQFPGLSGNGPHTVAFWVKVPADAQLSDAYAMVAWGTTSKKLLSHSVHISWNRNPEEGPMGAVRTDFGGGSAIGMTSLRDGRWHHVAVIFAPGEDPAIPVQVKQYVDGKLESSATNPPGHTARRSPSKAETPANLKDVLWLGCRLGLNGQKLDRFRGEIDQLVITDGGMEPNQIVQLMRESSPAKPGLEVARVASVPSAEF